MTRTDTGVHFGTHLDAPCHFIEGGKGVDELDLDMLVGPCVVARFWVSKKLHQNILKPLNIPEGTKRLLLKTDNSALWETPNHDFDWNLSP